MATLRQDPQTFPWELFMQAQAMKNRNQQQMFQDIQGIGSGLGQIGLDVQDQSNKKKLGSMFQGSPELAQLAKMYPELAAKALFRQVGQKPPNPLDDALKQERLKILQQILLHYGQPKPTSPVASAALDVKVQSENAKNAPWWKKFFGNAPVVTNPLKKSSGDVSTLTDDQLLAIINESDEE